MLHICGKLVDLAHRVRLTGLYINGLGIAHTLHGRRERLKRSTLGVTHKGYGLAGVCVPADRQRIQVHPGHADKGKILGGIHIDHLALPGAPALIPHHRRVHARKHVCVRCDKPMIHHEPGTG